ncbi:unnamed protein product, partial [Rotaria magnacalcarata]
ILMNSISGRDEFYVGKLLQ